VLKWGLLLQLKRPIEERKFHVDELRSLGYLGGIGMNLQCVAYYPPVAAHRAVVGIGWEARDGLTAGGEGFIQLFYFLVLIMTSVWRTALSTVQETRVQQQSAGQNCHS